MVRKLFPALIGVSMVAAACGPPDIVVETVGPQDVDFVRQVVDVEGDVGLGLSMASDREGNPHMSYLAFEAELEPGEVAPPADVFAPTLPAVKEAHLIGGVWTRSGAADDLREQPEEEPDPDAPPPEPGPPLVEADDETALALDGPGAHHVAWTQGDSIRYTSDAAGQFEDPQTVFEGQVAGLSIAADDDGAPSIAFYELQPGPEGPGALVRVATLNGDQWQVETAAEADVTGPPTTAIGVVGNELLVAYSSAGNVSVARSGQWESEEVADGVGVSMDVDGDGNPHLAFFTNQNVRHAHSIGGSPWDVTPVGDAGSRPEDDWSTSIAVAEDGIHHVVWQMADAIGYANNAENQFQEEEVPGAAGAWGPRAAAGPEGDVYLAWYDTQDQVLTMAVRSDQAPLLAAPPVDTGVDQPTAPIDDEGPPPCGPNGTEVSIGAPPGAAASGFDTDCLAVSPGEAFTIEFVDDDAGVPHNVAVYTDATAEESLFVGDIITGPETIVYEVDPIEEGRYFFRCDLHPTTMTGTLVVE